jgi:hypothetical protein
MSCSLSCFFHFLTCLASMPLLYQFVDKASLYALSCVFSLGRFLSLNQKYRKYKAFQYSAAFALEAFHDHTILASLPLKSLNNVPFLNSNYISIISMFSIASCIRVSVFKAFSACSVLSNLGFVTGWRGVNTVQQSS